MQEEKFKDKLIRLADELLDCVYPLVKKFPVEERFALADQIRRATVSIGANIAEGFARHSTKDVKRFCRISYGLLAEMRFMLRFASRQKFITEVDFVRTEKISEQISKLLYSFLRNSD